MSDIYKIVCGQKITRDGVRNSFEEVMDIIIVYDIVPPFKVYKNNVDVTESFIQYAHDNGYIFVNQYELSEKFPLWILKQMNKAVKKRLSYEITTPSEVIHMKVYPIQDIKSIEGFYDLYKKGFIAFANNEDSILCIDIVKGSVCIVESKDEKYLVLFSFCSFDKIKENIRIVGRN